MTSASLKRREDVQHTRTASRQQRDLYQTHPDPSCMGSIAGTQGRIQKVKGNDNTEAKCVEASNTWALENPTIKANKQKQTLTKEDIHTISLHNSKEANKATSDSIIKSCMYFRKGHKQGQCPPKDKTCNKCNKIGHFAN